LQTRSRVSFYERPRLSCHRYPGFAEILPMNYLVIALALMQQVASGPDVSPPRATGEDATLVSPGLVPNQVVSGYPVARQPSYLATRYPATYNLPEAQLPLYPARLPDPNPSRSLWYSGRYAPWTLGHWHYPRYVGGNESYQNGFQESSSGCSHGCGR